MGITTACVVIQSSLMHTFELVMEIRNFMQLLAFRQQHSTYMQ